MWRMTWRALSISPYIKIDRKRALGFGVDIARSFAYMHSRQGLTLVHFSGQLELFLSSPTD